MRLPEVRRRAVPRPLKMLYGLFAVAALGPLMSHAIEFTPAPSANLDFSNLGRIGIAGDFDGISLYQYTEQTGKVDDANGGQSIIAELPNGGFAQLVSTDASIRAMCTFMLQGGEMQGVVMGGNFTSVDGTQTTAVALFNPNTTQVTPLAGLEGEVNAVYCDQERNTVYVGGSFRGANSTNAIAWYGSEGWTNLPFAGFNGPVQAITKAPSGRIIFGGQFTGLGNATAPREPDGQTINLSTAQISAQNSASTAGFSDPKNIVCSGGPDGPGNTWLVADDTPGFWDATFDFGFEPTKLRLRNTHQDGRGTKTFRFNAFPINGIMNLTYFDAATKQNQTCTSECPLSNDPNIEYQDFHFINTVGMNHFQIAISAWYGKGAGLAGVELFQDKIFSYAISNFNEPKCGDVGFPSTATATGPWSESPSLQSSSKYLTAQLTGSVSPKAASVVFSPNIRQAGNYSVNMYTPGCQPDGTCGTRGRINVTGTMSTGATEADFTTSLWQTNNFDKYDQIYFGYIEQTSDSFKPTVTITPLADQDLDTLTIVAQRIGFSLITSTGGLNGLYEFDPDQVTPDSTSFDDSIIDKLGASLDRESAVTCLVTSGETMFIGGNFSSPDHTNIMSITGTQDVKALDGGLNGQVLTMHLEDTKLYAGGDFSNTMRGQQTGLNHVGVYDIEANTWSPLGAGVDGIVQHIVPFRLNITQDDTETAIAIAGPFSKCQAFANSNAVAAEGFAIWVPSQGNWLANLDLDVPDYSGSLIAAVMDLPTGDSIYAGSLSSAQVRAYGAATLDDNGLGRFPITLDGSSSSSSSLRRRDLATATTQGVVTGMFYDDDDKNITVLAGHFSCQSSDGSIANNLVFIDGEEDESITGLGSEVSDASVFVTLDIHDSTLFAGGSVNGTIGGNQVAGIIAFDLDTKSFPSQPAPLSGANSSVSAISVRPSSSEVYVGGSFEKAGALECPGLCQYNADTKQWNRPGNDFSGDVRALLWSSKSELHVGGDLLANSSEKRTLITFNAQKGTWKNFAGAEEIPGPVDVLVSASDDEKQVWVSGSSSDDNSLYLMKYDGKKWLSAPQDLLKESRIRGLQVFTVTKSHDKTDLLGSDEVLMLTGAISIPNFGTASAAIFNGTDLEPYAITTIQDGGSGTIARIFTQKDNFFSSGKHQMPLVFIILIGLAIALALILLIVVAGIVLDRLRKKREGYTPAPTSMYDRGSGMQSIAPRDLFQSLGKGRPDAPHV